MGLFGNKYDRKKGSKPPKCVGPRTTHCEAQNCRNGTIQGYPSYYIYGYNNCRNMWTCRYYEKYNEEQKNKTFGRNRTCDYCVYCGNTNVKGKYACVKTAYKNPNYSSTPKSELPIDKYVKYNHTCIDFKDVEA